MPKISVAEDEYWMQCALAQASIADSLNEVPVGAVLVMDGRIIGRGFNQPIGDHDPTAHAEMKALRDAAGAKANYRLPASTLYVTVEPCTMCFGAMVHARVARLVYATTEPKAGVIESAQHLHLHPSYNHRMYVTGGVLAEEAQLQVQAFFQRRRQARREQKQMVGK
ncbi:tRNA adenosine(34) deaminase TadA [Salinibius halmophilus]|uniref:tRNA adenosine(34) deaminase TadA n=1 Tax=Salinibius halmophilus TaxID=1853216 RepID=UPI000E66763D|nr:tRNA adenosine(34) deaminase TadA [Salinibius halmophilus]